MAARITLLTQRRIWVNGFVKALWNAAAVAGLDLVGLATGAMTTTEALKTFGIAVGARVLQYLLTHEPPDLLAVEEMTTPSGTTVTRTTEVNLPPKDAGA